MRELTDMLVDVALHTDYVNLEKGCQDMYGGVTQTICLRYAETLISTGT